MRSSVVLPLPDGPSTAVSDPWPPRGRPRPGPHAHQRTLSARRRRPWSRRRPVQAVEPPAEEVRRHHGHAEHGGGKGGGGAVGELVRVRPKLGGQGLYARGDEDQSCRAASVTAASNTRKKAASSPGRTRGSVTRTRTAAGLCPNCGPPPPGDGGTRATDAWTARAPGGRTSPHRRPPAGARSGTRSGRSERRNRPGPGPRPGREGPGRAGTPFPGPEPGGPGGGRREWRREEPPPWLRRRRRRCKERCARPPRPGRRRPATRSRWLEALQ